MGVGHGEAPLWEVALNEPREEADALIPNFFCAGASGFGSPYSLTCANNGEHVRSTSTQESVRARFAVKVVFVFIADLFR